MAIKKVTINHDDKDLIFEFEDDLPFGIVDKVIANTVDLSDVNRPKVKMNEYRRQMLLHAIKKSPEGYEIDSNTIQKLSGKLTIKLMEEVSKIYPLAVYLEDLMKSLLGSMEEMKLDTESTPIVPQNLDGIKNKSTNNPQNTSKE